MKEGYEQKELDLENPYDNVVVDENDPNLIKLERKKQEKVYKNTVITERKLIDKNFDVKIKKKLKLKKLKDKK